MKISSILLATGLAMSLVAAAACSGGGGGDDASTTVPTSPTPACTPITDTSLSHLQSVIFSPSCGEGQTGAGCHDVSQPVSNSMALSNGQTYASTVGVTSVYEYSTNGGTSFFHLPRVNPGDHDHSFLYLKVIAASGIQGSGMPSNIPGGLCQAKIDAIKAWIDAGAPNN
jgi:hypothetical protein